MQNEIIITLSLYALGAVLLGYTLYRAIMTAYSRGYASASNAEQARYQPLMLAKTLAVTLASQQLDSAHEKLTAANAVINHLKTDKAQLVAVTHQEIGVLVQAENMIKLAHRTWAPMKGVEPTARKASSVHQKLVELNARLSENAIRASAAASMEQAV
jgi:hypothetical protein